MLAEYQIKTFQATGVIQNNYAGITFLYPLQGTLKVKNYGFTGNLHQGELLLINRNSDYEIAPITEDNMVIKLEISNHYFTKHYKDYFRYKYIIDAEHFPEFKRKILEEIKYHIASMMLVKIQAHNEMSLQSSHLISDIMLKLVSFFQEENAADYRSNAKMSDRVERILKYIEGNYQRAISLTELSEQEHLSVAYLSRLFKSETEVTFTQYLTKIRFEHAVYDLVNTTKPIYQIIEDNGFSDGKIFQSLFKKQYQETPSEFRQSHKADDPTIKVRHQLTQTSNGAHEVAVAADKMLPALMLVIEQKVYQNTFSEEYIQIERRNIEITHPTNAHALPTYDHVIFVGDICSLLQNTVREQLLELKANTRINFVEVSYLISGSIISPDILTDEDYSTYSIYYNSDVALSFLYSEKLSLISRIYHSRLKDNLEEYIKKAEKFLTHCIQVYGVEYVSSWRFVYYTDDTEIESPSEYFRFYQAIKKTFKRILPALNIGLFYPHLNPEHPKAIYHYDEVIHSMDFLAFRANFHEVVDLQSDNHQLLQKEISYIEEKSLMIKQALRQQGCNIPLYLIEWNTLTGNTRRTNGSYFRGALILNTLLSITKNVQAVGVVLNTEIQGEIKSDYSINVKGIAVYYMTLMPRPIFFVLKFLNKLKGKIIAKGEDHLITSHDNGYQIFLTNTTVFTPYLSIEENLITSFKKKKIFSFKGLKKGTYQVKQYIFDQQHGALYYEYERFKTRYGYDFDMLQNIKRTAPKLSVYDENIDHHGLTLLADLDINAIHFYELKRIE